jgi:hypothetical protein
MLFVTKIMTALGLIYAGINHTGDLLLAADDPVNSDGGIKSIVVNGKEYRFKDWYKINPDLSVSRIGSIYIDRLWDFKIDKRPEVSFSAADKITKACEEIADSFVQNHQVQIAKALREVVAGLYVSAQEEMKEKEILYNEAKAKAQLLEKNSQLADDCDDLKKLVSIVEQSK